MFVVYFWFCLQWMYIVNGQAVQSAIRCYGTGWVMDESCPANHKMFPVEVRVGSLALSTGCPDSIVKGTNPAQESSCCTQTDSGCINTYRNTQNDSVTYVYHVNCIGKQACTSFAVVRSTTTGPVVYCNQTLYHGTTTVLEMRYQCIEDDQFFTPSNVGPSSKLGLYSVHITLQDYAVSAISPLTSNIECSVESSECDGRINIIAKDLRLHSTGGQCFQNISINETENGVINTFNCDDNTNFIQNLDFFKSQTNHIILTFTNAHQQPGGYFWIQLVSANSSHTLSVNCPPVEEDPRCYPTTEPPTTTTTAEITSTTAANNGTIQEPVQPKSEEDNTMTVVISVVVVVLVIIVVVIIVALVINKNKLKCKRKGRDDEQTTSEKPSLTTSNATVNGVHIIENNVRDNPAIGNEFKGTGQQVPPRSHRPPTETAHPSEQPKVLRKETAQGHQPLTKTTQKPLPEILSFNTEKARSLDDANERQKGNRHETGRSLDKTNETGRSLDKTNETGRSLDKTNETKEEYLHGHLSSTVITKSFEINDEITQNLDQSSETKKKKKKGKKKKHHKNKVSAESDPQNDITENQSKAEKENQEDVILKEISEDQDFNSTHARGNAEYESDATRKKKKKKKKKKSKTVDQGEDCNDKTEQV